MSRLEHPAPTLLGRPAAEPATRDRERVAKAPRGLAGSLIELTKPGITRMVVITVGVGFAMGWMTSAGAGGAGAARPGSLLLLALATLAGAALSSAGAGALNEWLERERDSRMHRTRSRPIPDGRVRPATGLVAGLLCSLAGVGLLLALVNWAAAAVSLATILSYIALYTPLKPRTPLATIVGAIPGALPPLIGWAGGWQGAGRGLGPASTGAGIDWHGLDQPGGWSIVLLMTVWQIPHFLAIAWLYREDYARGGHLVLPVLDPSGDRTAATALLWCGTLIPVSLLPVGVMQGRLGWAYAIAALALGTMLTWGAWRFARSRSNADAKRLFFASIIHLPLILGAMALDAAFL